MIDLFNIPVMVMDGKPDKSGDIITSDNVKLDNRSVCVVINGDTGLSGAVGTAFLTKRDNVLYANISLLDDKIELDLDTLTPSVSGKVNRSTSDIGNNHRFVTDFTVDAISLNIVGNIDDRVKKLEKPCK